MRALFALLLLGLLAVPARGQTIWSRPYQPNQIAVEAVSPDVDDASVLSGATFLTGTVSLNSNVEISGELPLARLAPTTNGSATTTAVGNPYVGLGFSSTRFPILLEIGARLPAAPSNAAARLGQSADVGRVPAFQPEEFGLSALLNGRLPVGRNSSLRLRSGFNYASRPDADERDGTWRLLYEAQLWREGERLITGFSFAGRAILSTPRSTQHHAAVSVMGNWRRVQPGLVVGTALNDLVQDGEFTPFVGLTLSLTYRR